MGRQYGALMASEMKHIYEKGIIEKLVNECGMDIENLKDRASKFYANYPFRFKEIICGMSEDIRSPHGAAPVVNAVELIAERPLPFLSAQV